MTTHQMYFDVEKTIQHAKQQLLDVLAQMGTQITDQMQIAVRNELIKNMNKDDEEYGKILIDQKISFPKRYFAHWNGNSHQLIDIYNTNLINVMSFIILHDGEYIIHNKIVDNKLSQSVGVGSNQSCNCIACNNQFNGSRNCAMCHTSYGGGSSGMAYCSECVQKIRQNPGTCKNMKYFDTGSYYIEYYTNFCNKYVLKMTETAKDYEGAIIKGSNVRCRHTALCSQIEPNVYVETPIKTNVKLNKIFIDLLKISNFDDSIFRFVSDVVSKYWNSDKLGDYELRYEKTCIDLQQTKQQLESTKLESEAKTSEIERLKHENENLKKQLTDVDMFKKCVAMLQTQQANEASPDCQSTQIGNPV